MGNVSQLPSYLITVGNSDLFPVAGVAFLS